MTSTVLTLFLLLLCAPRTSFVLGQADAGSIANYAPTTNVPCPQTSTDVLVRTFTPQTQALNAQEQSYINARESNVIPNAWSDWVGDGTAIGYNLSSFIGSLPRVGIAVGGAGYRAAQFGAGVFSALDARNTTAKTSGTGGLLQVASYLAGSSGGSWLTGSLLINDWPSLSSLVYGDGANLSGWMLDLDLIAPSSINLGDRNNQEYWGSILASVEAKANTSIDTSVTDLWGRMVSYHFSNQTTRDNYFTNNTGHGAGQLWSQIPLLASYANQSIPFPVVVSGSLPSSSNASVLPLESTVYEASIRSFCDLTPFEFGSWDPNLSGMAPMTYAGTHLVSGLPANPSACVTGFDQVSFIMGSSASFFNQVLDDSNGIFAGFDDENGDESGMNFLYEQLSSNVQSRSFNVANWPNAFQGVNPVTFQDSSSEWLSLVDGGSNLEQVPLGSLLAKARAVDVVVAVDASSDDPNHWPNGTSLLTTSQRISSILSSSHQALPPMPLSTQDFVSTGVNQRPTFFGCNPSQAPAEYPLVIYLPNSPPLDGSAPASNTEDFQFSYSPIFTAVFINQVFQNTMGGFKPNTTSPDPNWGKCLQCAALDRARLKVTPILGRSDYCAQCFSQYCYDPSNPPSVDELPGRNYVLSDPDPGGVNKVKAFLGRNKGAIIGGSLAVLFLIGAVIGFIFWWRKRTERKNRYSRVHELRDDDEPWKHYDSYSAAAIRDACTPDVDRVGVQVSL
ncbi:phospholipase B [Melanogaster broomeanus]|nr:phospholipase B [Melanogaster broomeanus]